MRWIQPPKTTKGEPTPSRGWYLDSECRTYRIGKALVNGEPVYTLAKVTGREPELVAAGTLAEVKAAAK